MKKIYLLLIVLLCANLQAQQHITIEQAMDIALKKNFDIQIARNDADINRINNTKGNAGMLPTITLNGTSSYSLNNVNQKLSSGTTNKYNSQSVINYGTNALLSWTLFDGGKMFITKNKLAEMQALGDLQFNARVLEVMYNVVSAYYDIVQQKQVLNSINEVINYNKQRVTIAQTGFNAGTLAKTDFLQAQIDLNVSMENAVNQRFAINEAEKSLNILLGQDATIPISVSDSIPLSQAPDKNEMLLKIESANANLQALKKQIDVANLAIKEAQKNYLPTLNLQGEMFLNGNHYSEGSTTRNRTHGMQIGGTLSIPLYNGGETKRKISLARNELLNAQLNLDNERLQINRELQNSYNDYENQLQLLQIEKQNNQLAKENMDICLQRLKLGQTTSLEVHQSQESYAQSSTRLINFEYNVKLQETRLKQLIADL